MRALWLLVTLGLAAAVLWWFQSGAPTGDGADLLPDAEPPREEAAVLVGRGVASSADATATDFGGVGAIRGTVEDTDGNLLAGIVVELRRLVEPGYLEARPGSWCAPERVGRPMPYRVLTTTRSDADGAFRFRGLPTNTGEYMVHAIGEPPRVSAIGHVWFPMMQVPLRLVMSGGSPVRVRVIGPDGARVRAFLSGHSEREGLAWTPCSFQGEETGADGRATLNLPDGVYRCEVHVPGVGSRSGVLIEVPQSGEFVVHLGRPGGATLQGKLTDTSGEPISGAHVLLVTAGRSVDALSRFARTAADGTYRIKGLLPGRVTQLSAAAPGFVTVEDAGFKHELRDGLVVQADFQLVRGGVIEGRIRGPDGRAVVGARIKALTEPAPQRVAGTDRAVTDGNGRYRMTEVPIGAGHVRVSAPGLYQPDASKAPYVIGEESEHRTIDITLARGIPVSGRVVDAAGRGVARAEVSVEGRAEQGWWRHDMPERTARSDTDGTFTYAGLPPSGRWRLTAKTDTLLSLPVDVRATIDGGAPPPVKIVVRPGAVLEGRVLIPGDSSSRALRVHARHDGATFQTVQLRRDRTFRVTGLVPGEVGIYVVDWQHDRISNRVKVKLVWGQVERDIELKTGPLATLAGIVVDEEGKPVSNLRLSLGISAPGANRTISSSTNVRGRFAFPSLPATDHVLTIRIKNKRIPGVFTPGDREIRIVHSAPERVRFEGTVRLPDGTPAGGGGVMIWETTPATPGHTGQRSGRTLQISAGVFGESFERQSAGSSFEAEIREVVDAVGRFVSILPMKRGDVEPGARIEFLLEAGLEVAGIVVDADGAPVPGVRVSIAPQGNDSHFHRKNMKSRADGSFYFGSLSPGALRLRLERPPAPWVVPPDLPIEAGDTALRVTLRRGGSIRGRVLGPGGRPVPEARVQWRQSSGASISTRSGVDGRFELSPVPPDSPGSVRASPPTKGVMLMVGVSVGDVRAGAKDLELRLPEGALIRGELTGPDGEPLSNAWVTCHPLTNPYSGVHQERIEEGTHFELGPLPLGRYRVEVQVGGAYLRPPPVEVSAPVDNLRIVAPKGVALSGTLVGAERPERFSWLFLRNTTDGRRGLGGNVTAAGTFLFTLAADEIGTLFLRDNDGGGMYGLAEGVRPSATPLTVTLQKGLTIEGRFDDYTEGEMGNVYVKAASGLSFSGQVAKDGSFVVAGVPPGVYDVHAIRAGKALQMVKGLQAGTKGLVLGKP